MSTMSRTKAAIGAGALVLAGFGGGAALMVASSASADDEVATGVAAGELPGEDGRGGPGGRGGPDEEPLTGATLERVTAVVQEAYPNAEIERAETDSGGVYEAHIVTGAGERLTVLVNEAFEITGTETGGPGGRGGDCLDDDTDDDTDDATEETPAA